MKPIDELVAELREELDEPQPAERAKMIAEREGTRIFVLPEEDVALILDELDRRGKALEAIRVRFDEPQIVRNIACAALNPTPTEGKA